MLSRRTVFFCLVLLLPLNPLLARELTRIVPLLTIHHAPPPIAGADHGGILFTDEYAFFGTDGGLFRAPLPLGSAPAALVAFDSTPVTAMAWSGDALYVAPDIDHGSAPGVTQHTLLRSTDDGTTWTPIDGELEECLGQFCKRLISSQLEVVDGLLFANAGGNVIVTEDDGASWSILFGVSSTGKPQGQACYDPTFAFVGRRLLLGGECPLDSAYLRAGTLRPDLHAWETEPETAITPFLENRNVQFIRRRGATDTVFAGIEGALLRSDDAGASYRFVLHYELDAPKYPYITQLVFPSAHPTAIVIAGFDKASGGPFLAVSLDDGMSWRDDSLLLPGIGDESWSVVELIEAPDGRILIAVEDDKSGALHVSELQLTGLSRRRAVAR